MADSKKKHTPVAPHKVAGFKGYTITELRQQRIMAELRMELMKEKLVNDAIALTNVKILADRGGDNSRWLTVAGKAMKIFSYADLIGIGWGMFKSSKKLFTLFRRR